LQVIRTGEYQVNKPILNVGIIGAGPAGSMAGLLLSKSGHSVTIFEKRAEIPRRLCGEYLCPQGVELLEKNKLKDKLLKDFLPLYGMVLSSPQGIVVDCTFPKTNKLWSGVSVNRQKFDNLLIEEAKKCNAKYLLNTNIKNLKKIENRWQLFSDENEFNFDLVIAADGRVSSVAKSLNHSDKMDTSRVALHCYLPRKKYLNLRYGEMHIFEDGSYCGLDPINDDEVNVSFVIDVEKVRSNNLHELCNKYLKQSKRLIEMFDLIPNEVEIKTITPLKNVNHFIAGDGLAYVGDASGFIDPLTGEGIYNALLSSQLLSEAINSCFDLESALALYKKNKKKLQFQKKVLNTSFQFVIKSPLLCYLIAKFIQKKKERADLFIGIIGNIYTPINGLLKMLIA
jgi:flavin-dependent dehydrogenase